jgi:hypothetical protein
VTKITDERLTHPNSDAPATAAQLAREQAIKQIERKRRYWISTAVSTVGMVLLAAIWALAEYHNAGGWPTHLRSAAPAEFVTRPAVNPQVTASKTGARGYLS